MRACYVTVLSMLLGYAIAFSQEGRPEDMTIQSETSRAHKVDAGSMTNGNDYHSDYFNFDYRLPDGFVAGTDEYRQGIEKISGVHSSADTFILLHADKRLAPHADVSAGITLMADRLSRYPSGATERDYLHHFVTKSVKGQGNNVLQEGDETDVSGHKFFRADYKVNGRPMYGYQTVMLTFRRGFALSWTFIAPSKADLDGMITSMEHALVAK